MNRMAHLDKIPTINKMKQSYDFKRLMKIVIISLEKSVTLHLNDFQFEFFNLYAYIPIMNIL